MTTPHLTKSIGRSPLRLAFLLIPVALGWFALSPAAQAACQEGCLTNQNTVLGDDALFSLTTGTVNTAIGLDALYSNTTGSENTAIGTSALYSNDAGSENTAIGLNALTNNNGDWNTAVGFDALASNTTGVGNTATGFQALFSNTIEDYNTATGWSALKNSTAGGNTAYGFEVLSNNTTGKNNTAIGGDALLFNTIGSRNVGTGLNALAFNTIGGHNIAYGNSALANENNTAGERNIALGYSAAYNLTAGNNNIDIGNVGVAAESNTIRIGSQVPGVGADGSTQAAHTSTYIAGISGTTITRGVGVVIDATTGRLGTKPSSARFKDGIKPMEKASEAILALRPVTFRYKHELDPEGVPQFGLVAEDVEKVNPDLIARDADGKPYTVRYEAVNAMLLNEFLKEHRTVQELKSTVAKQEATILQQKKDSQAIASQQQKQIEALAAGLQKVSAQVEASKPSPQVVNNDQ